MKRTKLINRKLPDYTRGEEIFNMVSHIVGAVLYGLGKRIRYMHSVFHLFVLLGCILQYVSILLYVIVR